MRNVSRFVAAPVCAAVALMVYCFAPAATAGPASGGTGTTTTLVRPTTHSGQLKSGYHVTTRFRGAQCLGGGSEAVVNADRCFAGNFVFDPCWPTVNHRGNYGGEICLSAPWKHSVAHLRGKNPHNSGGGGRTLWGLRLNNGTRCDVAQGATGTYHHRRLNFYCGHDNWLVGHPNRTRKTWTILEITATSHGLRHPRTVRIHHAWLGLGPV